MTRHEENIQNAAKALGMTVAEYMKRLQRFIIEIDRNGRGDLVKYV